MKPSLRKTFSIALPVVAAAAVGGLVAGPRAVGREALPCRAAGAASASTSPPTGPAAPGLPAGAARPASPNAGPHVSAEGRVVAYPGADVVVGTDFAGRLARVLVDEKDAVRRGDLLAEIDASEERAALEEARARIAEADADLKLGETEVARARQLLEGKVGTQQALDRAERDRDAALARRQTARADAERLAALVTKSRLLSPIDGVVVERHVSAGETVARGDRAFRVADLGRLRVEAEVDESETGRIRGGAAVALSLEEAPGREFGGHVEEIPDSVQPRKTRPQDPAKPVDTRVLLVKVALDGPAPLKLGRRVEVAIADGSRAGGSRREPGL